MSCSALRIDHPDTTVQINVPQLQICVQTAARPHHNRTAAARPSGHPNQHGERRPPYEASSDSLAARPCSPGWRRPWLSADGSWAARERRCMESKREDKQQQRIWGHRPASCSNIIYYSCNNALLMLSSRWEFVRGIVGVPVLFYAGQRPATGHILIVPAAMIWRARWPSSTTLFDRAPSFPLLCPLPAALDRDVGPNERFEVGRRRKRRRRSRWYRREATGMWGGECKIFFA